MTYKIIAIGITTLFMWKNEERRSNFLGGLLILVYALTFFNNKILITTSLFLYLIELGLSFWMVLTNKINCNAQKLVIVFLFCSFIKAMCVLLHMPMLGVFLHLYVALVFVYLYLMAVKRSANVLVITTIPAVECIITLYQVLQCSGYATGE